MAQLKELKRLKVWLKEKQLNKINALDMDGSLSIKIERLIDIALAAINKESKGE